MYWWNEKAESNDFSEMSDVYSALYDIMMHYERPKHHINLARMWTTNSIKVSLNTQTLNLLLIMNGMQWKVQTNFYTIIDVNEWEYFFKYLYVCDKQVFVHSTFTLKLLSLTSLFMIFIFYLVAVLFRPDIAINNII